MSKTHTKHEAMIAFNGLTKQYGEGDDAVTALEHIDFDVERGTFVSIVGPSGCGKTTLLHTVAGILDPTRGNVSVDSVDVQDQEHQNNSVGLVFQQPVLLDWRTVRQNILLPAQVMSENGILDHDLSYYKDRATDLINLVGLEGFGDAYPQELSGGMQQRVTICQSLIYDPPVLLMDEPFGSLDALTKDQLNLELLRIWNETEKTILFITHDLEEAVFLSDRVIVLDARPGRVVDTIRVDLPRPRGADTRSSDQFHECVAQVYSHFRE